MPVDGSKYSPGAELQAVMPVALGWNPYGALAQPLQPASEYLPVGQLLFDVKSHYFATGHDVHAPFLMYSPEAQAVKSIEETLLELCIS